ncbi:MAG: hypothetical protein AB8B71_20460 [Paracoccaceae bacterium]
MLRWIAALGVALVLGACAAPGSNTPLPVAQIQDAAFVDPGPKKLKLITVVNNRTGAGGHTALLVSGSQQVIFDPAGSFRPDWLTEHGDVLYGVSPTIFQYYQNAHARSTHHIVSQEIQVSPAVAEQALALVQAQGNVASAFCANSTSSILRQLPGFQDIATTFYPVNLQQQFAQRPGVVTRRHYEDDDGNVLDGIPDLAPTQ